MMHLITGGSASGKSAYAEQQLLELPSPVRYYVATMQPWGEEGRQRVARHRAMRADKQFHTIECYSQLEQLVLPEDNGVLLLECMSNLAANEQFEVGGSDAQICDRIGQGIRHLQKQTKHIIIVTNEVFSDGCRYDADTERYIRLLGQINVRLAELADQVTEVVYGLPIQLK
ncbi:MAG: bifunctional adenosylcobinamide kinase/adenosylcobinamide-phosphate guanylyltransferase [Lachnospiraceae bacterium]|nr:bifunctional adenosylcobinamide kinase/adenosylcobinamide-phosphate guanylyltransferase [Lachnospiraceae bacterium]